MSSETIARFPLSTRVETLMELLIEALEGDCQAASDAGELGWPDLVMQHLGRVIED